MVKYPQSVFKTILLPVAILLGALLSVPAWSANQCSSLFLSEAIAFLPLESNLQARKLQLNGMNVEEIANLYKEDSMLSGLPLHEYKASAESFFLWNNKDGDGGSHWPLNFEIERYRLFLLKNHVNPLGKPASWEKAFKQIGYSYLQHETKLESLISILKEMKIKTRENRNAMYGGDGNYVYLGMPDSRGARSRPNLMEPGDSYIFLKPGYNKAIIILSPKVLDELGFSHVNGSWEYGYKNQHRALINNYQTIGFLNYLKNNPSLLFRPEWLVPTSIDLNKIDFKILINSSNRTEIEEIMSADRNLKTLLRRIEWVD